MFLFIFSIVYLGMFSIKAHTDEIKLGEVKIVTATGWISDGTRKSVNLVKVEAIGGKNVAQDIANLFNAAAKSRLNNAPDLSHLMSSLSLKIRLQTDDGEIIIKIITVDLISLEHRESMLFFRLENGLTSNGFVPSLEKLLFAKENGYWKKMKEIKRLGNDF